jgi:hypothetical protein
MTSTGLPGVALAAKDADKKSGRRNPVLPKICHPAASQAAAATIGLIFAGALSAFFDQDR